MNCDYEKKVSIESDELEWQEYSASNSFIKQFSKKDEEETSLIKIEKNSFLSKKETINSVEIFVLEGVYINEFGSFEKGIYLKLQKENEKFVKSDDGCTIFRKINYKHNNEELIINTKKEQWFQGQGNLTVMPLAEQTALVKWPKGEIFIPHKHWGGEEIFVLSGTFIDEHGTYKKNCWIRSPPFKRAFSLCGRRDYYFCKNRTSLKNSKVLLYYF